MKSKKKKKKQKVIAPSDCLLYVYHLYTTKHVSAEGRPPLNTPLITVQEKGRGNKTINVYGMQVGKKLKKTTVSTVATTRSGAEICLKKKAIKLSVETEKSTSKLFEAELIRLTPNVFRQFNDKKNTVHL